MTADRDLVRCLREQADVAEYGRRHDDAVLLREAAKRLEELAPADRPK